MQTQLTAINTAKILTSACLIGFAIVFGIQDVRQVIYLQHIWSRLFDSQK